MARIRTIKPEFWTSPTVVRLTPMARLLFVGSWNFADDWGLLIDDPERLRLQVLPADPVEGQELVDELVAAGLLARVTSPSGDRLLAIPSWTQHQKIDSRTVGRWGNPAEWETVPPDPAESHPIPLTPAPVMEGKGMEGNLSSSSAVGFNKGPVDNPDDEQTTAIVDQVIATRIANAKSAGKKIINPSSYAARARANLRTEDDGKWWARLQRLVVEHDADTPLDLLALAAEGDYSQSLRHYRVRAAG